MFASIICVLMSAVIKRSDALTRRQTSIKLTRLDSKFDCGVKIEGMHRSHYM